MGACSSKPKTAEFEGNMNFYLQQEMETRKNLDDDDQKRKCDAGSESIDVKTAEFEAQEEMARKNLKHDQKSIDRPEQTIFSRRCSLQNLKPGMENKYGGMGDMVLESEEECLAGSGLENKKKETCARAEGICGAKHHFVAEGESLVPEIGKDSAKVQNRKKSLVQELYEEPTFAQKEDVLGSVTNSVLYDEVVIGLLQKVAFGDAENGKFQIVESINEDKKLPSVEGRKPRIDAEEGNQACGRATQEPVFLASEVLNVDFKLKINSAGNLMNCGTKNAAASSASRAANGTMLIHNDKSRDLILEKPCKPEGLVYGSQQQDVKEALKEPSVPPTQETEWTNLMVTPSNDSLAIKERDFSHNKQKSGLILCPDDTKVFEVVEMPMEQGADYERHSAAASQPFKTFQELSYGKDMVSDMDEVLEKLASEFERQESLSSVLP